VVIRREGRQEIKGRGNELPRGVLLKKVMIVGCGSTSSSTSGVGTSEEVNGRIDRGKQARLGKKRGPPPESLSM